MCRDEKNSTRRGLMSLFEFVRLLYNLYSDANIVIGPSTPKSCGSLESIHEVLEVSEVLYKPLDIIQYIHLGKVVGIKNFHINNIL